MVGVHKLFTYSDVNSRLAKVVKTCQLSGHQGVVAQHNADLSLVASTTATKRKAADGEDDPAPGLVVQNKELDRLNKDAKRRKAAAEDEDNNSDNDNGPPDVLGGLGFIPVNATSVKYDVDDADKSTRPAPKAKVRVP